ncbi:MAG TPA: opioid growth factor receptor-related protein [Urbifossiella sp.]|jgi:hypothetical protein|nr:opioid growth factor receptor-related protein [Urbifossiella sp.]
MPGGPIAAFYRGEPDARGRRLDEILAWDDTRLEDRHDFIQYLFPLREPSPIVPDAPLVTDETVAAFAADETLRERLARALDRMLAFYGLRHDPATGRVDRTADFGRRAREWLTARNHNFLRLTRILTSLRLLGLPDRSAGLLACLEGVAAEFPQVVGNSLAFWQATGRM